MGLRVPQHSLPSPRSPSLAPSSPRTPGKQVPLKDCRGAQRPLLPAPVGTPRETPLLLPGQCPRPEIPRRAGSPGPAGRAGGRLRCVPCSSCCEQPEGPGLRSSGFPQLHGEALSQTRPALQCAVCREWLHQKYRECSRVILDTFAARACLWGPVAVWDLLLEHDQSEGLGTF